MKLLLDENLSSKLCRPLDGIFPGSSQVVLVGLAQANDRDIWDYAAANGFTVVSLDADFAEREYSLVRRQRSSGYVAAISRPMLSKSYCGGILKSSLHLRTIRLRA
jgi:hypothetical protein